MAGFTGFHTETLIGGQPLTIDLSQPLRLLEKPPKNYHWIASAVWGEVQNNPRSKRPGPRAKCTVQLHKRFEKNRQTDVDAQAQVPSKLDPDIIICNKNGAPLPPDIGLDCGYPLTLSPERARDIGSDAHGPQTTFTAGRVPSPGARQLGHAHNCPHDRRALPGRSHSIRRQVQQPAAVADSLVAAENTQGHLS